MAEEESPCIIIIMSSAKTTLPACGAFERSAVRSLIVMFHKVGPETYACGQPLVTRLELTELPNVIWAARSLKKSFTIL